MTRIIKGTVMLYSDEEGRGCGLLDEVFAHGGKTFHHYGGADTERGIDRAPGRRIT